MRDSQITSKIRSALNEVKPFLAWHHGGIKFVKFEKGIVYVKMLGACHGCPLAGLTLKSGVEKSLKAKIKEVKGVEAV